jgi:hypothetical protein
MAGSAIQASIDAYGRYARASNLADYLELLALVDQTLNRKGVADLISDRTWIAKMDELFEVPGAVEARGDFEEPDQSEGATDDEPGVPQANRVFDVLDERIDLLGDLYPFTINDELAVKDGIAARESPYVAVLALTLAHAHQVDVGHDPTRLFEDLVARTLRERGLNAVNVGAVSREAADFKDTIERSGVAVELQPTPDAAITLKNANEEGVDALAHLPWGDVRPGLWAFLGQATCGKSDSWSAKIEQPKPQMWKEVLNLGILPLAFLAVPHHVESHHLSKLVRDSSKLVVDRIRLVRHRDAVTADEADVVDKILETGAEKLA